MAGSAKVESIDLLKALRRTLFKFAEAANVALSDAESDLNRTLMWIQTEQLQHWTSQIRKRAELVSRCEEAVRQKKIFVDSAGRRSSAIDEIKALERAKKALAVAHEKLANCKSWARKLEKEIQNYRGIVQRLATTVQSDLPVAAAKLQNGIIQLEAYVAMGVPIEQTSMAIEAGADAPGSASSDAASMKRAEADEREEPVKPVDESESTKSE
ncbi:MAG: hypothetical protein H7Z14_05525 [Anaerolineae bacterium]|nr:hypothetical protein [Phycisphaerae bacterium]